ncbi:hypothetical protein [Lutispora saccharofermentans]|uniref:Uncharacterized protein n=1 Tax=Lutispora saccharofermentans TaxID=3024236 RepID=A0ABT1NCM2_9FIRM|nr:hypothetical protein [Lutispora saccharofermentans]MCQ1529015.1 hypothetical protein [Lutispora saccharofermentans]
MKKIQITLTVEEGKEIIALGMLNHPVLINTMKNGKMLFKGGTTVSKITEKLLGVPLRISGRITSRGTVSTKDIIKGPHSIIYYKGQWTNIDETIVGEVLKFTDKDLIICGANAFDNNGNAAIMAGSPGGGAVGQSLSSWYTEGAKVIIPVGIEKIIPGDLNEIIKRTGRNGKSLSWGMSVGLMPLKGELFTEIEAIKILANVDCFPIGAGGLGEAHGSSTLEILAPTNEEYEKIVKILKEVKSRDIEVGGIKDSLVECEAICNNCIRHIGCGYKSKKLQLM